MSEISRTALFGKLNALCYKAVEGATVFCKLRGNPYVELEHWLAQLLQNQDSDLHHIVRHYGLDASVLAKDLTEVFTRVGGTGVGAILGKPPFPVMEAAYKDAPITPEESRALVGFLQDVDKKRAMQTPKDYGNQLVLGGTGMFIVLMGLYSFAWRRRKAGPVNQAIFDRQVKSQ